MLTYGCRKSRGTEKQINKYYRDIDRATDGAVVVIVVVVVLLLGLLLLVDDIFV